MKIKINETEIYEYIVPETVTSSEFRMLVHKLNKILKLLDNDPFLDVEPISKSRKLRYEYKYNKYKSIWTNRDEAIRVLKTYLSKDKNALDMLYKKYDTDYTRVQNALIPMIKRKHKVLPMEVEKIKNSIGVMQ